MKNKKTGILSQNALTGIRNEFYPKVAFDRYNTENYFLITGGLEAASVASFDDTYVLAEPLDGRWGYDYDILQVEDSLGVYVFSFSTLIEPPTTTEFIPGEMPEEPFLTLTGSRMNYAFKYDYISPVDEGAYYHYSVAPFEPYINYSRPAEDANYGSAIPVGHHISDGFYFIGGKILKLNNDGATHWTAEDVLGYDPQTRFGVVDKTGVSLLSTVPSPSTGKIMLTKINSAGAVVASGPFEIPQSDIPFPFTHYLHVGGGDLILKPNGEYYAPSSFLFSNAPTGGGGDFTPTAITGNSHLTASFRIVGNTIEYNGFITGVPEETDILSGSYSSIFNWKFIPDTEDMYYSHKNDLARIDSNTNQVVWWVKDINSDDELTYVLPNKNVVKPTYDPDGTLRLVQYSYSTGAVVNSTPITLDETSIGGGYPDWKLSINNLNGHNDLIYVAVDGYVESEPTINKSIIFALNTTHLYVEDLTEVMGDSYGTAGLEPAPNTYPTEVAGRPSPYGYHCVTQEGSWWMWYEKAVVHPTTSLPVKVVAGLMRYCIAPDGGNNYVVYHNLIDLGEPFYIHKNEGFSFMGDAVFFPTKYGVHTLVDYLLS